MQPSRLATHSAAWWVQRVAQRLRRAQVFCGHGTDCVEDEARWLVQSALGRHADRPWFRWARSLTGPQRQRLRMLLMRRLRQRRPLAYLTGWAYQAGLRFRVDRRVLIPRSPLAGWLLQQDFFDAAQVRSVADFGTGSGCLAIAAAQAFPDAHVDAIDVSSAALAVAGRNIRHHRLAARVRLQYTSFDKFVAPARGYDLIIANPPYLDAEEMASLPPEYRHEPALALDGGDSGGILVDAILARRGQLLADGGCLLLEVGVHRQQLEERWPDVPFFWCDMPTGDTVALLGKDGALP